MDFFARQDSARRRTAQLIAYFCAAVVLIVVVLNTVVAAVLAYAEGEYGLAFSAETAAWTTALTLLVIAGGSLFRRLSLVQGGRSVAAIAGGTEAPQSSSDPAIRRLLNVVEEMSIASGVPMPAVYILEQEAGINAFAAGFTPSDAVIAVTRGAINTLTRDELQGVVAHEFSHLLNGDMRLNIRLVAVLFGILMLGIIGRGLLESLRFRVPRRSRGGKDGGGLALIVVMGIALVVIGYIGYFFGLLIQAAVSRQREYLADASAVQFTRNPAGLAGALKKIGASSNGSIVTSHQAVQFRHFFFAQGFSSGVPLFATHPALEQRIRLIEPDWDGQYAKTSGTEARSASSLSTPRPSPVGQPAVPPPRTHATDPIPCQFVATVGLPSVAHMDHARQLLADLPSPMATAMRDPQRAPAALLALLLSGRAEIRHHQMDTVRIRHGEPFAAILCGLVSNLPILPQHRLPLLNLALPALRSLPRAEAVGLHETASILIAADGEVSLFEFMLEKAFSRHVLGPTQATRIGSIRYTTFEAVSGEIALLLSALSRVGSSSAEETAGAFKAAAANIPALEGKIALLPPERCSLDTVSAALDRLVESSPVVRKVLLQAGSAAIAADGVIEPDEAELLRAVADALDCPIPPVLNNRIGQP